MYFVIKNTLIEQKKMSIILRAIMANTFRCCMLGTALNILSGDKCSNFLFNNQILK